jgi:filamentous hemagglutinin family protein
VKLQVWVLVLGQIISIVLSRPCVAQVLPDQTLPVGERSQVSGDLNTQINGGAIRGNNLFHSFQQFSIPIGGSAAFNNPANITNILTRVTGGNISNIDGLIRANGTANLFLINPNGILFGANARLEIGGSFLASTAASLKFANGFEFSASNPQAPPLLTISAPIGLQYGNGIGEVRSQGAILQVPNGQTLNLTGGNVAIEGGQLLAPGGRVELAGVAAASEVGLTQQGQELRLSVPDGLARADVSIGKDAIVNVRSGGDGSIAITARSFSTGLGTRVLAGIAAGLGTVEAQAGDIDLNATEAINLDQMAIGNQVLPGGTGNAGNLNITTGTLSLTNGAQVSASTFGQGNAGNVTITAKDAVSFGGVDSNGFGSGALSSVSSGGIGQGGSVTITTSTLSLTNGAQVVAATFGQGNAGNVTITARDAVSFDGMDSNEFSSGAFSSVEPEGIGQGGNISITTGTLSLTNGGAVIAATFGQGNAGNVTITASDAVSFDGPDTGAASTVESRGIGQGGTIAVNTSRFSITNGAQLSASSQGQGAAGNLEVAARQLRLDTQGSIQAQTASGRGGDIILQVPDLLLLRRGSFISSTAGTAQAGGNGGNITFNDGFIVAVPQENSNISANAFTGRGGNIRIATQGLFGIEPRSSVTTGLSSITASSQFGISGTIALNTPDIDPSQGIAALPSSIIDSNALIANSCIARRDRQGRFVITGTGGLAPQPDDLANAAFPTYELVPQPFAPVSTSVMEADRIFRASTGEIVLGRSCE